MTSRKVSRCTSSTDSCGRGLMAALCTRTCSTRTAANVCSATEPMPSSVERSPTIATPPSSSASGRARKHLDIARDEVFEQAVERIAPERPPAFVVESMDVVTEPAGSACEKGADRPGKMVVTALGAEADARHALLAGLRKRHHRIATRSEGANATSQPGLDLGARAIVGKSKACLRRLEPRELGAKHVEACLDQPLGLGRRHLSLVHVTVAVWHHVVAARLQLVPEAEVALAPLAVPLLVRLPPMAGREDVQLGNQPVALEDLGGPDRGAFEAVIEAQRDDVHAGTYSVVRGSTATPVNSIARRPSRSTHSPHGPPPRPFSSSTSLPSIRSTGWYQYPTSRASPWM